jgi:ribosomal protein S4
MKKYILFLKKVNAVTKKFRRKSCVFFIKKKAPVIDIGLDKTMVISKYKDIYKKIKVVTTKKKPPFSHKLKPKFFSAPPLIKGKSKFIRTPFIYYRKKVKKWRRIKLPYKIKKFLGRYKWKFITKFRKTRQFFWKKRKTRKRLKFWWNFSFFVKKHLHLKGRRRSRKKLGLRYKDVYKKKIFFRRFLIKRYKLRNAPQLKTLLMKAQGLMGDKVLNLFFFLELQVGIVCLRMHFFWKLGKARSWIKRGAIYVNGRTVKSILQRTQLNDLIKLALKKKNWTKYFVKAYGFKRLHSRLYKAYNCAELSLRCLAGIFFILPYKIENMKFLLRRKKKMWLRTKIFSYLIHSFH